MEAETQTANVATPVAFRAMKDRTELVYANGHNSVATKSTCIFGMSPGNTYFTQPVVTGLLEWCSQNFSRVLVVVPDEPAQHTFTALGSENPKKRAKKNGNEMKLRARRGLEYLKNNGVQVDMIRITDWEKEFTNHPEFQQWLERIEALYQSCEEFRSDCRHSVQEVLKKRKVELCDETWALDEASKYVLKEVALMCAATKLFGANSITTLYHRRWPVLERVVAGEYDPALKSSTIGLVLMEPCKPSC